MSITIYEGAPGSGKSYDAVREIERRLKTDQQVFTNVEGLQRHLFTNNDLLHLMSDAECSVFWKILPPNAFLMFDEALTYFPADFGKFSRKSDEFERGEALLAWATKHRHDGQDAVFIVQDRILFCGFLRKLADVRILFFNHGHLGFRRSYLKRFFSPESARREFKSEHGRYKPEIFRLYQSVEEGSVLAQKTGRNILLRPFVIIPLILVLATVAMGRASISAKLSKTAKPPARSADVVHHAPVQRPVAQQSAVQRVIPTASAPVVYFDVVGRIELSDRVCFLLQHDSDYRKLCSSDMQFDNFSYSYNGNVVLLGSRLSIDPSVASL